MARIDTWGWYTDPNYTTDPATTTEILNEGLNGTTFGLGDPATGTALSSTGGSVMVDDDEDGLVNTRLNPASIGEDRYELEGTPLIIEEIAIYSGSTITYETQPSGTATAPVDMRVLRLENGQLVFKLTDNAVAQLAENDIYIEDVTGFQLGAWDEAQYSVLIAGNFDDPVPAAPPPCFVRGTLILTDRGERAVEDLRSGDLVLTRDAGLQPIRWIGSKTISAAALKGNPNLKPVRIRAGALRENAPSADLLVSPQHRILVRSNIAQRLFGTNEVLVAAKQLLMLDGIDIAETPEVEYFHILFDDHQVIFSNGAETESLYTGAEALKSVGSAARKEIFTLFPELRDLSALDRLRGARMLLSGRQGRKLAHRHAQNGKPLVM